MKQNALSDFKIRVSQAEWIAQFDFRASGPERGGGNLQLWYAKDGPTAVGTSSIYTAGQFDGFVLVIDSYGGRVSSAHSLQAQKILKVQGRKHSRLHERWLFGL